MEDCIITITCTRAPVFITGKYNKYARGLSQSPWVVNNEMKGDSSVAELVSQPLKLAFGAREYKFHSAGREDVDVRMLGEGRPFVVELIDARRIPTTETLSEVQEAINSNVGHRVSVNKLSNSTKSSMLVLREGEMSKRKQYTCIVWAA